MTPPGKFLLNMFGPSFDEVRREAARTERARAEAAQAEAHREQDRLREAMNRVALVHHVVVGTTQHGITYRIPIDDMVGAHSHGWGASGSGKSFGLSGIVEQLDAFALDGEPIAVIEIDGKAETADLRMRSLGGLIERRGIRPQEIQNRVFTLSMFHPRVLPAWALFAPRAGQRSRQVAGFVAEVLEEVVGGSTLGSVQRPRLQAGFTAMTEGLVEPVEFSWMLGAPRWCANVAARVTDPEARRELLRLGGDGGERGQAPSIMARWSMLTSVPTIRAILSSGEPFDFARVLAPGTFTTINFGGGMASRHATRAMGSIVLREILAAALDPRRRVRGRTLVVIDEPQTLLCNATIADLEIALTQARSFGVSFLFVHQTLEQLPSELSAILAGNVALAMIGRLGSGNASQTVLDWCPASLPPGVRVEGAVQGADAHRREWIRHLGALPRQTMLISDRRTRDRFEPQLVRMRDFAPPSWNALRPETRNVLETGAIGRPRAELEGRADRVEAAAAERYERELAERSASRSTRAAREEPIAPRRRRKGGIP